MKIAIIGAGASGLMAAIRAAEGGAERVWLFEKNTLPGRKILITGNGRCNVTNTTEIRAYPEHYFGNGKFLYKALNAFSPRDLMDFFETQGVKLKEEDGRVFPASDKAQDILDKLFARADELGVAFHENEPVVDFRRDADGHISKVVTLRTSYDVDACVLCVGGSSYSGTGSTGDGYLLAARLGHTVVPIRPALAPIDTDPQEVAALQGVSIRDVRVHAFTGKNEIAALDGDVLFTHFGLTGPAILGLSRFLPTDEALYVRNQVSISIDLWPAVPQDAARTQMIALLAENQNRKLSNVLKIYGPESLISLLLARVNIPEDIFCHELKKDLRDHLTALIKNFSFIVSRAPSFSKAMVTAGGVSLKEVDPKTMQSKLIPGLYFAGEVLDIDGDTGGYNLQAAFSTGFVAGTSAVAAVREAALKGQVNIGQVEEK